MIKVSVIIPNYNRAAIVGDTVENMLRQSLQPHEVIVIDDGSTDDSVKVLEAFGNRITLIQQQNKGPGAARNIGLERVTGTFVQLMDSDDIASLNKLETQAEALVNEDADIAYSPWAKVFINSDAVQMENTVLQQKELPDRYSHIEYYLSGWSVVLQQCLLRASFIKKVGLYRTDMWTCDDSDFFFRMLLRKPKISFSEDSLTLYRLDDYGKVTGSGATNLRRVEDWGQFLLSVFCQSKQCPLVYSATLRPQFLTNVWKTIQQLEEMGSTNRSLIQILRQYLQSNSTKIPLQVRSRVSEIAKGIQYRVAGHRWSACYQAAPLTRYQQALIEDLGLKLTTRSPTALR